jgi:hypothetical protein
METSIILGVPFQTIYYWSEKCPDIREFVNSNAKYLKYASLKKKCIDLLKNGNSIIKTSTMIGVPFQTIYYWSKKDPIIRQYVKKE